jgi:hypothetical protein
MPIFGTPYGFLQPTNEQAMSAIMIVQNFPNNFDNDID